MLSTPSLGITIPEIAAVLEDPSTFNSLSRDHHHEVIDGTLYVVLSTPSLGITYWSGGAGAMNTIILSTPSLGITRPRARPRRPRDRCPFNSLSRDHFFKPKDVGTPAFTITFNSLSRDHFEGIIYERRKRQESFQLPLSGSLVTGCMKAGRKRNPKKLSTPSLGITTGSLLGGTAGRLIGFQLPLSGSLHFRRGVA